MNPKKATMVFLSPLLLSALWLQALPAPATDRNPEQDEQVKLKSAKWGIEDQKATALLKAGKYQEAETIYKKVLDERRALNLDLFTEQDSLGQLYLKWGKKDEAEKVYQEMVADREKMSGEGSQDVIFPLKQYADALDKTGKKEEAKKARLRAQAIQKDLDSIPSFGKITAKAGSPERLAEAEKMRSLGEKCMRDELQAKALVYFNRSLALNPNDPYALRDRGEALQWSNKFAMAMLDIDKAINLKKDFQKAYVSRAFLNDNLNHRGLAMADFIKAVTLDPKDVDTMGTLAKHYDEQGKHKEAVDYYSKIIAVSPALYWPYVQRAVAYTGMAKYKEAIADYTTLVDRAPEDPDYHEYRGAVYVKAGDLKAALEDYNHLIALNPTYPVGYRERGKIFEKMDGKKSPRVVADYAKVKKLGY